MSFGQITETGRPVKIKDEGITVTNNVESLDFMGAGVGASGDEEADVNIPGPTAIALNDLNDVTISGATSGQVLSWNGSAWVNSAASSGGSWGSITGTLSNQTDLQVALNAKQASDAGLTDIASLAVTDGNIIVGDGANWVPG